MASTNKTSKSHVCTCCGGTDFYLSNNHLHKFIGEHHVCKKCMQNEYDRLLKFADNEVSALYNWCQEFNIPFYQSLYEGSKNSRWHLIAAYMKQLNSFSGANNYANTFLEGEKLESLEFKTSKEEDFDNIKVEFTEEDKQVKKDTIRLLGYDPFAGYSDFDQKFLYGELLPYLDEDTLEDQYKLSQIIQIINNNNQIRKIDFAINKLTAKPNFVDSNASAISSMTKTKFAIVQANDKIAKENSISVKNRGDKRAGASTFTYMMKKLRELNFEDAEHDYYDQLKSYGMKRTADISNKSILEQLQFDENDYTNMIKTQREIIDRLENKLLDLEEENRQLYVKINKLDYQEN